MEELRSELIQITSTPTVKRLAQEKAKDELRSLSDYIYLLIIKDLRKDDKYKDKI